MTPLLLLASIPCAAQELTLDRPAVPSAGIAAENGPGTLWVNPANLAYDPDPRYGVFIASPDVLTGQGGPSAYAFTAGVGGVGVGAYSVPRADGRGDWTLDYATSIPLPDRFAIGWRMAWHLVGGGQNYVSYDFGGSWRPLPWLGFGATAMNVGSPDPSGLTTASTGAGLALRPIGDALVLGADWEHDFGTFGSTDRARATARLRPVPGLYLRGHYASDGDYGVGAEIYFGGVGGGAQVASSQHGAGILSWVGTDEPGESLVRSGRRVPSLYLDGPPDYQPRGTLFSEAGPSWLDTLELMRRAETDRGVRGMVVSLGDAGLSWARYQELRQRIRALEDLGKPVVVYLHGNPGNGAYWAATAASRIALHPAGGVDLHGLAAELMFFRGTLDLIGVEPQFVRRSEYKSAVEQNTASEPSEPSLEQTEALLDGLWHELVQGIADGRAEPPEGVEAWIDGGPWSASEALARGLVDVLLYPDEIQDELDTVHGVNVRVEDIYDSPQPHSPWEAPAKIAVIYITGAIVPGWSSNGGLLGSATTGSWTIVNQLEQAQRDPQVRAVVLRVDSPGGSAFASDEIWHAVELVQGDGKPVVVSMGGVAASGGYYVSASADAIWAEPTTITGSIGVYSGKFSTEGLLDRIGVTTTTVARGRNATIYSSTQPWDAQQRARMEQLVEETYIQFKSRVSDGRGLTMDEVEDVARGRVWTGSAALENGLVDHLGGLQDAIADAHARAGLPPHRNVALISYSGSGAALESLSPALVRVFSGLSRREQTLKRQLQGLQRRLQVLDPADPLVTWTLHPEVSVWLMDPWVLEVDPR